MKQNIIKASLKKSIKGYMKENKLIIQKKIISPILYFI